MRAHLFYNPNSGDGEHAVDELEAVLHLAGYETKSYSVKDDDFEERLAQKCDLIVAAGGDGTIAKVLRFMPDRKIPVAILPLGTANNIATSLGITGEPEEIAHRWTPGRKRYVSIGRATGPWGEASFVESVGFGAMVEATDKSVGRDKEGKSRLLIGRDAFRKAIEDAKPRDLEVSIDGKELDGDILALEILNVGYAGPGLPLCPSADPGDDFLDVVVIRKKQRDAMMAWIGATEEATKPPATVTRGKTVVIRWKGKPPMRIDDRSVEVPDEKVTITVELEKKPVTVLVPPGTKSPGARKPAARARPAAKTPAKKPAAAKSAVKKPAVRSAKTAKPAAKETRVPAKRKSKAA